MARLILYNAVFFLLPFAIYGIYVFLTRGNLGSSSDWSLRILGWLLAAGAGVMLVGLVVITSFSGAAPDSEYHPATLRDGQIVPGGFE
jgi:hypothetical protein